MSLYQQIENEIVEAMKAQAKPRLLALRNIKTYLKNLEIEQKSPLLDEQCIQALATLAKQRSESIDSFLKAGRQDLVDKEKAELEVIKSFLPPPLSHVELDELIQKAIQDLGAQGPKDMGKVMGNLKKLTMGRADGKLVSQKVKAFLNK